MFFKIGDNDYSMYVKELVVSKTHNYNAQTNAAGDSVVDYINSKRTIGVTIIHVDDSVMPKLLADLDAFNVSISYRNPKTNVLEEGVNCICSDVEVDYYTIQEGKKVMYKETTLEFTEL